MATCMASSKTGSSDYILISPTRRTTFYKNEKFNENDQKPQIALHN